MREMALPGEDAVDSAFPEVEELARGCRFRDCGHGEEPGCAVRAGLETGEVDEERLEGWFKLRRESAWLARKEDRRLRHAEQRRWKQITKDVRRRRREEER
jgi:ribosome biogenesis GTPase